MKLKPFVLLFSILLLSLVTFGCVNLKTDPNACESLSAKYSQKDQCFREVAKNLNDSSICSKIEDTIIRDYWCFREIAYDTKNSVLCNQITDAEAKQSCLDVISGKQTFERGVRFSI